MQEQRKPTVEELMFILSRLEERIAVLEQRTEKRSGVVLTGARKTDQAFYAHKQQELAKMKDME